MSAVERPVAVKLSVGHDFLMAWLVSGKAWCPVAMPPSFNIARLGVLSGLFGSVSSVFVCLARNARLHLSARPVRRSAIWNHPVAYESALTFPPRNLSRRDELTRAGHESTDCAFLGHPIPRDEGPKAAVGSSPERRRDSRGNGSMHPIRRIAGLAFSPQNPMFGNHSLAQ
jgi:hypothetical protein